MRRISLKYPQRNNLRKNNSQPTLIKYQNKLENDNEMNIDNLIDVELKEKLHSQIDQINNQIETIGLICDKRKRSSFDICKSYILSERKKLNHFLEESLENLKKDVQNYKNKYNIDYSSHLNELKKKVKILDNQYRENNGFYITRTNIPNTTRYINKKNEIENQLKIKMNFIIEKILNNINKENKKKINLQRHFTSLYSKTNNIYMDIFKNFVNEIFESETIFNEKNQYSNGINSSSINSINISKLSTSNDGYMNKLKKKEIIINFLENIEVKKLIYHLLNNNK